MNTSGWRWRSRNPMLAASFVFLTTAHGIAVASADHPAALVVYPYLVSQPSTDVDTTIRLSNTDDEAVDVRCYYENATPQCIDGAGGESCIPNPASCSGTCVSQSFFIPFEVGIEAQRPLAWQVSAGIPGDGSAGGIPSAGIPFVGALRCLVINADGTPSDRNVLIGSAIVRRVSDGSATDNAEYNAVGIRAVAGAVDSDNVLVLGGTEPEYEPCPNVNVIGHFFDRAVIGAGTGTQTAGRRVSTRFALARCGQDPSATSEEVTFLVANEFRTRISITVNATPHQVLSLSTIGDDTMNMRIESQGTITGHSRITSPESYVVIALETHLKLATGDLATNAFNASGQGQFIDPVLVMLEVPPTPTPTSTPDPAASPTVTVPAGTPTATATPTSTPSPEPADCPGDCDGSGIVAVNEAITGINIALGRRPLSDCTAVDVNRDGAVRITDLVATVNSILNGCP